MHLRGVVFLAFVAVTGAGALAACASDEDALNPQPLPPGDTGRGGNDKGTDTSGGGTPGATSPPPENAADGGPPSEDGGDGGDAGNDGGDAG